MLSALGGVTAMTSSDANANLVLNNNHHHHHKSSQKKAVVQHKTQIHITGGDFGNRSKGGGREVSPTGRAAASPKVVLQVGGQEKKKEKDNYFVRVRGSDPRAATCRGKLQNKRSKLNQEINKEMRLRAGAENLFKATTNKKLKDTVALELSFFNSNLQLLKEQLAELNSSVEIYQSGGSQLVVPMIPLGLKETKEIDFREPFKDFILEHYSEDGADYEDVIAEFMDTRQAMRTPTRNANGVRLLYEYYNQLYYVERRFFPPERSLGIYFEWYDSLTGIPSCQRTVAFEKASLLFNIGALYTQIGAKQDRLTSSGLDSAVDNFLRAAGTFRYIHENFTNAPSMDLSPEMLEMLVQLMLAQARESLFEKLVLSCKSKMSIDACLEIGQEASQVMEEYKRVHSGISSPPVKDYVPYSWISLVLVKRELYHALSHYHVGVGLIDHIGELSPRTMEALQFIHADKDTKNILIDIRVPRDDEERKLLGKSHLREAVLSHEESMRVYRMCRELKKKDSLHDFLRNLHERAFDKYTTLDEDNDFCEVLDPPDIVASTKFQMTLAQPDFSQYKVEDIFRGLGPVSIFNAKHHWSVPRTIAMKKHSGEGFGFSVRGDAPVMIAGVDSGSVAALGGMKEADFIVGILESDVKWASHEDVVAAIKKAGDNLTLKVITPMDKNSSSRGCTLKPKPLNKTSISPTSTTSSSSGVSSGSSCSRYHTPTGSLASTKSKDAKKLTWNLFKKGKDKREQDGFYQTNVILR